jgi:hypothetical protein
MVFALRLDLSEACGMEWRVRRNDEPVTEWSKPSGVWSDVCKLLFIYWELIVTRQRYYLKTVPHIFLRLSLFKENLFIPFKHFHFLDRSSKNI